MPIRKARKIELNFSGKLITASDPVTIGENFQSLINMDYGIRSPKSIAGMTKINTTALSDPKIRSGIHLRKTQPAESKVLVQAYNSGETSSNIYSNSTAIPGTGDFDVAGIIFADGTGAGRGRFSPAPNNQIAYCNGVESCIYGGDEMNVGAFINFDPNGTFRKDFTQEVGNTKTDALNLATLKRVANPIDANTICLLNCETLDGSALADSSTGGTFDGTLVGTAARSTAKAKFGTYSVVLAGNSYITIPDPGNFTTGIFTFESWIYPTSVTGTQGLFSQKIDANDSFSFDCNGTSLQLTIQDTGANTVYLSFPCLTINTWQHVALVGDGTKYRFFHNGRLKGTFTATVGFKNYTSTMRIGVGDDFAGGVANYLNGYVDETRISDVARWTDDFTTPVTSYTGVTTNIYIGLTRPAENFKFNVETANATNGSFSCFRYTTLGWTAITGVVEGTNELQQDGTISFSEASSDKPTIIDQVCLYWYWLVFNGIDDNVTLSRVTAGLPFQTIKDTWDGELRKVLSAFTYNGTDDVYTDITPALTDDVVDTANTATFVNLDGLLATDSIIFGGNEQLMGFVAHIQGGNKTANTYMTVSYSTDGKTWTAVSNLNDGTVINGKSFAKSGVVSWTPPALNTEHRQAINSIKFKTTKIKGIKYNDGKATLGWTPFNLTISPNTIPLYFYKVSFSATLAKSGTLYLYFIGGITAPKTIGGYKFPFTADNRLFLCNNQQGRKNTVLVSAAFQPDIFNGSDTTELEVGNGDELMAACALFFRLTSNIFNMKLFFTTSAMYGLLGTDLETYESMPISNTIGCIAPETLKVAVLNLGQEGDTQVAIWQAANGIYIFTGAKPQLISQDIANFFDPNESAARRLHPSYAHLSVIELDMVRGRGHFLFADGNSTGTLNRELAYNFLKGGWIEIDRGTGKDLQYIIPVMDTNGQQYPYGCIDTGYLERLEYGTTFDGNDIVSTMRTGSIAPIDGSVLIQSELDKHKLITKSKNTTANSAAVTHYKDENTSGTSLSSVSPANADSSIKTYSESPDRSGYATFHSFEYSMTTNDETIGFEPLYAVAKFYMHGEDLDTVTADIQAGAG